MLDRGEIYGEGVNLAARLEAAAQPGGVCISSFVHEQIASKIDFSFVDAVKKLSKILENQFVSIVGTLIKQQNRLRVQVILGSKGDHQLLCCHLKI